MDVADFLRHLDQLFELDAGTLTLTSVVEDTPGWSSLTFLGLIALIDERYNVALKPRQVLACITFADLLAAVNQLQLRSAAA